MPFINSTVYTEVFFLFVMNKEHYFDFKISYPDLTRSITQPS